MSEEILSENNEKKCCDTGFISPLASLEENSWSRVVKRLAAADSDKKGEALEKLLGIVVGVLEASLKKHPRPTRTDVSPNDVTFDILLKFLLDSITAKPEYESVRQGVLKVFHTGTQTDTESQDTTGYQDEQTEQAGESVELRGFGGLLCDYNSVTDNCIDYACDDRFNGTCWKVPSFLRPVTEEDCECILPPDWWDVALVALFIILVLTPIPGDEALAGGATLARLLRLIVRLRPRPIPVPVPVIP